MKKLVLAFLAGIFVGVGLAVPAAGPAKRVATRALDYWNSRKRYALRSDERPFTRLAASQVGYAPSMRKQFSAPHPFEAFRVVNEADGKVAFVGRTPVRSVQTHLLGPGLETVWIGDLSALTAPGRYRTPGRSRSGVTGGTLRCFATAALRSRGGTPTTTAGPRARSRSTGKGPPCTACISPPGWRRGGRRAERRATRGENDYMPSR